MSKPILPEDPDDFARGRGSWNQQTVLLPLSNCTHQLFYILDELSDDPVTEHGCLTCGAKWVTYNQGEEAMTGPLLIAMMLQSAATRLAVETGADYAIADLAVRRVYRPSDPMPTDEREARNVLDRLHYAGRDQLGRMKGTQ